MFREEMAVANIYRRGGDYMGYFTPPPPYKNRHEENFVIIYFQI